MKTIVPSANLSLGDLKVLRKEISCLKSELARLQKAVEKLALPEIGRASGSEATAPEAAGEEDIAMADG